MLELINGHWIQRRRRSVSDLIRFISTHSAPAPFSIPAVRSIEMSIAIEVYGFLPGFQPPIASRRQLLSFRELSSRNSEKPGHQNGLKMSSGRPIFKSTASNLAGPVFPHQIKSFSNVPNICRFTPAQDRPGQNATEISIRRRPTRALLRSPSAKRVHLLESELW